MTAATADADPPTLTSMTGFARLDAAADGAGWTWEVRSVNSKGLDVRTRLPPGFERLEQAVRAETPKRFKRGAVSINLTVSRREDASRLRINRALLDDLLLMARDLAGADLRPPSLDGLLAVRGVVEPADDGAAERTDALAAAIEASLAPALDRLAEARREEGRRLAEVLAHQIDRIATLVGAAAASAGAQPAVLHERLRQQLLQFGEAVPPLSADRLAQEVALLLVRGDIREELDRLTAHVAQAREMLAAGGAAGRRLDFLCQEFNREANTLCSKSTDVELTRIGLDLKLVIEQLREQVQNIE